jgi:putative endonuclease
MNSKTPAPQQRQQRGRNARAGGYRAEQRVARWLEQQGVEVIAQNYRTRLGEIDLILQEEDCIAITEIRQRRSTQFGGAAASIDPAKQQRLIRLAQLWLQQHPEWRNAALRFDAIVIDGTPEAGEIRWIRRAFSANA